MVFIPVSLLVFVSSHNRNPDRAVLCRRLRCGIGARARRDAVVLVALESPASATRETPS
jgi:hypothetical protein